MLLKVVWTWSARHWQSLPPWERHVGTYTLGERESIDRVKGSEADVVPEIVGLVSGGEDWKQEHEDCQSSRG